ncbi:unnamed protein product, partial [Amoebophrya sp. A25]
WRVERTKTQQKFYYCGPDDGKKRPVMIVCYDLFAQMLLWDEAKTMAWFKQKKWDGTDEVEFAKKIARGEELDFRNWQMHKHKLQKNKSEAEKNAPAKEKAPKANLQKKKPGASDSSSSSESSDSSELSMSSDQEDSAKPSSSASSSSAHAKTGPSAAQAAKGS